MRKSLGKRLISGVTAALTAVMIFPNVAPTSMAGETADINSARTVFSLDQGSALKKTNPPMMESPYKTADELYAQISFEDETGSPSAVDIADNQYYLLVHAVGKDGTANMFGGAAYKYADGESRDAYQLIEIGDGPKWTSAKLDASLCPSP